MDTLQSAKQAMDDDDPAEAIRLLVGFWRDRPVPAVANAVVALDEELRPELIAEADAWIEAANAVTIDTLGVVARSMVVRPRAAAEERFATATSAGWPADPRLGAVLASLLDPVKWTANSSRPTWERIFDLVELSRDPRFLEVPDFDVRKAQRNWLLEHYPVEALQKEFPDGAPTLSPQESEMLASILAPSPKEARAEDAEEALLERIYADPVADGPRLVFADWLISRGDPRGEVIVRQVAGQALTEDQEELLDANQDAWIGPIARVVLKKNRVFRRGFLAEATAKFKQRQDVDDLGDHPSWATVERLSFGNSGIEHLPSTLDAVTALGNLTDTGVHQICDRDRPWRLTELAVHLNTRSAVEALCDTSLLPDLTHLSLRGDMGWVVAATRWLWRTPFADQLTTLDVKDDPVPWVAEVTPHENVKTLLVQTGPIFDPIRLERDEDGRFSILHVINLNKHSRDQSLTTLVKALGISEIHASPKSWTLPELKLRRRKVSARIPAPDISAITFRSDRTLVFAQGSDLHIGDHTTWVDRPPRLLLTDPGGDAVVASLTHWGSDGKVVHLAGDTRTVLAEPGALNADWHPTAGLLLAAKKDILHLHDGQSTTFRSKSTQGLAWSPSGDRFAHIAQGAIRVWRPPESRRVAMHSGTFVRGIAWLDDEHVVCTGRDGSLKVVHWKDGSTRSVEVPGMRHAVSMVSGGGRLLVRSHGQLFLLGSELDVLCSVPIPELPGRGPPMAVSSDGSRFAVGYDQQVHIYDDSGTLVDQQP